jgi:HPt (histidine-containing phosphotransfer) domain-containing protein
MTINGELMPVIDTATFEELKQMSGADFITELIDTFLEDGPQLIGQLRSALQANDTDVFRRAAHSLKSNAATFGASRLAALAQELETLGKEKKLADTGNRLEVLETAYESASRELKDLRL